MSMSTGTKTNKAVEIVTEDDRRLLKSVLKLNIYDFDRSIHSQENEYKGFSRWLGFVSYISSPDATTFTQKHKNPSTTFLKKSNSD